MGTRQAGSSYGGGTETLLSGGTITGNLRITGENESAGGPPELDLNAL